MERGNEVGFDDLLEQHFQPEAHNPCGVLYGYLMSLQQIV